MTAHVASLLILLVSGAPPGSKLPRVEVGVRAFNQGDFEAALRAFDAAVGEGGDSATMEKVHLLRAQCYAARQDFVRAEEAFASALEWNPDASLDPSRVDPTVVKMLEAVRARLTGTLVMNSTPPGADLFLDGKNAGVTPQTLQAPIGHHKLEIRWGEGPLTAIEVALRARKDTRVEWIQAAGGGAVPCKTDVPVERPIRPFGDLRFTLEVPATQGAYVTPGLDLGGGFEVSYFRVGLWARFYPYFGVVPRGQFVLPIIDQVNVFFELQLPLWFRNSGVALGLGGGGGAEWLPRNWVGLFMQIGGQHLFGPTLNPGSNIDNHFLATGGVRMRLP